MPAPYAQEFSPEMDQGYLASILNQIDTSQAINEAQARQEGKSGGLIAKGTTPLRIAASQANTEQARQAAIGQFNMDVANKKYSERMTDEARAFQDTERQKTEDFQKQMAQMGYAFESGSAEAQRGFEKNQFWQTLPAGLIGGAASVGLGTYLGRLGKAGV